MICLLLIFTLTAIPVFANETNEAEVDADAEVSEEIEEAEEVEEEDPRHRIHYSMARQNAIRNLPALTGLDDTINDLEEIRTSLRNLREHRARSGVPSAELEDFDRQIADINAQIQTLRINQEILRISTEFSMRNSMATIANLELDIKLANANLERERIGVENTRLRFQAGLVSESDLSSAELAFSTSESTLAAQHVSLATERQNLNRILQRNISGNYYVFVEKELMELPKDLEAHIRRYSRRQPNVRTRETAQNRARAAMESTAFGTPERISAERAFAQAEREHTAALRAIEVAIRNQYNSLTALMHQNQTLEIEMTRATERLEAVRLNYAAGLATPFDIEGAELEILRIEIQMERIIINHWNAQFMFQHPFMLVM